MVAAGAESYAKYCALCHGADAAGYAADNAPSLISESFQVTATDTYLVRSIREGRPGTAMAGYGDEYGGPLNTEQIMSLVSFLRSKGPEERVRKPLTRATSPGVASWGEEIYGRECAGCHGTPDARSVAVHLANSTFLATASDDFLRYAITHGRPGTPMPAFGGQLYPSQVEDLVAYLRSLSTALPQRAALVPEVPDVPLIINPQGKQASFKLREGRFVAADDVKKALEAKNRIIIIDARATSDWSLMRIPGAISVPYYAYSKLDELPRDGTWAIAYCACPHHASGVVVDELRKRGYQNSAVLDEGILEWQHRGYPTVGTMPASGASVAAPPPLHPPHKL